jgi:predicted nucleic acid-binding Zn ribbon protein
VSNTKLERKSFRAAWLAAFLGFLLILVAVVLGLMVWA